MKVDGGFLMCARSSHRDNGRSSIFRKPADQINHVCRVVCRFTPLDQRSVIHGSGNSLTCRRMDAWFPQHGSKCNTGSTAVRPEVWDSVGTAAVQKQPPQSCDGFGNGSSRRWSAVSFEPPSEQQQQLGCSIEMTCSAAASQTRQRMGHNRTLTSRIAMVAIRNIPRF